VKSLTEFETEINLKKVKCLDTLMSVFDRFVDAELFDPSLSIFSVKLSKLHAIFELEDGTPNHELNQHSFDAFVTYRRELARHMRWELGIETDESTSDDVLGVNVDDQPSV